MNGGRTRVTIIYRGRSETAVWYAGSTAYEIEHMVRKLFDIPVTSRVIMREAGGDAVVVSEHIPDGKTLFLYVDEPSPSKTTTTPPRETDYLSVSRSPIIPSTFFSPTRSERLTSSPLRTSYRSPGLYSRSPALSSKSPGLSSKSPGRSPGLSRSSLNASTVLSSSTSVAKEALKDVERLQKFISRIEDLRREKKEDFFEMKYDGDWNWKRSVANSEFMGAVSSDLYFQAGSCGLLSSSRRHDTEAILNIALSAYMDHVRELGKRGNFDPIVLIDASYARTTLDAAYDASISATRDVIRERLDAADRLGHSS